jgi:hypothetical protein
MESLYLRNISSFVTSLKKGIQKYEKLHPLKMQKNTNLFWDKLVTDKRIYTNLRNCGLKNSKHNFVNSYRFVISKR